MLGGVLARLRPQFANRAVRVIVPDDMPLVWANVVSPRPTAVIGREPTRGRCLLHPAAGAAT
ncbi:MAG: hypothetical protein HC828_02445 [Blastochloris sp.]|nr:hypothetical protein [Blastochloris sp.]